MSGIAAVIHFDGRPAEMEHIQAMTSSMDYRGPDGIKHWVEGSVALGQCTMHTTSEAREATLPLLSEGGELVLIFHGRIDNSEEISRRLKEKGASPRSRADAELVLQAYLAFGENCLEFLEGDYAGVIWDRRTRRAFCFRDIMGHKPFCYSWNGKTLSIASDMSALFALPWVSDEVDVASIAEFLEADMQSREATLWTSISRLPPSHGMICDVSGPVSWEYWRPNLDAELPVSTESDLAAYYLDLLKQSVCRSSRSHLPIFCEASGGLDSSGILAVAKLLEDEGSLPAPALHGVTFKIENDSDANDLPYARALAQHLGVDIAEIAPERRHLDWYADRAAAWHDMPGLPNGVSHLATERAARAAGGRVVLAGVGGDEWLSGTGEYADALAGLDIRGLKTTLSADFAAYGLKETMWRLVRQGFVLNAPAPILSALGRIRRQLTPTKQEEDWLRPPLSQLYQERREAGQVGRRSTRHYRQRRFEAFRVDAFALWGREAMERQAAVEGIEQRLPFEDRQIIELAYAVPAWMSRRGVYRKYYHRQAMRGLLPEDICWRQDKATFGSLFHEPCLEILQAIEADQFPALRQWVKVDRLPDWRGLAQDRGRVEDQYFRIWFLVSCAMAVAPKGP